MGTMMLRSIATLRFLNKFNDWTRIAYAKQRSRNLPGSTLNEEHCLNRVNPIAGEPITGSLVSRLHPK